MVDGWVRYPGPSPWQIGRGLERDLPRDPETTSQWALCVIIWHPCHSMTNRRDCQCPCAEGGQGYEAEFEETTGEPEDLPGRLSVEYSIRPGLTKRSATPVGSRRLMITSRSRIPDNGAICRDGSQA